jgi:zinc protease
VHSKLRLVAIVWSIMIMNTAILSAQESKNINVKGVKFIKSFAGIDEYRLDNGLKILLKPNTEVPLLSWQVWYKVGSRNESLNLTGIAHYLEHIMFKGTQTFAKGEIAQVIQLKGGVFNAFTSDDYTAYFENFAPDQLELAIKIESDRMQNSRLNADEINLERSVIVSELEGNRNDPNNILYETLRATAYQVHTYRNPVIGWRDDLDNINAENMREFYENYYYPDNAVAILVGSFDSKTALDLIQKYFGKYKPKNNIRNQAPKEPEQNGMRKVVIKNGGSVKLLGIAFHIPEFSHADIPALTVIGDVAFSGLTSRLYPKLVDTGLVSGISGMAEPSRDPGLFRVIANINDDADIKKVEQIIYQELEAVKKGITEDELKLAKAREEASFIYQQDGVYDEGLQIGYFESICNDWTKYANWVNEINSVTNADVMRVAKQYFTENNKTVVYLLPEEASDSLLDKEDIQSSDKSKAAKDTELSNTTPSKEANYGSATVDPINPDKLKQLIKISEPKYSKGAKYPKLDLGFNELDSIIPGVKILHREDHNIPIVYMNAYLYAGSVNNGDNLGLAYFTSKMLSRGTKTKDKYEIAKLLDLYGADISFESGVETGRVHVSTLTKYIPEVFAMLKEMLNEPRFDVKELERLKTQTLAQIKQEDDYPRKIAKREMKRAVYPKGHPYYSYSIEERVAAIQKITIDDLKDFYTNNYNTNNILISVVGDVDAAKTQELVLGSFKDWNAGGKGNQAPVIQNVELNDAIEKNITKADKTQTEITMGHACHIDRMNPDFFPLLIANQALGGSALSSRLGTVVRDENGLVYSVRTSFSGTLGAGEFEVSLGCNPKNTVKAIELTKKVIQDFLQSGINATELEITKSYLVGSFGPRTMASNEAIVDTLSQLQLYKLGNDYIKTYETRIKSITLDEVNRVARKYIHPEKLTVISVGP